MDELQPVPLGDPGPRGGPPMDLGRVLLGLVVVALGVVFLLDSAGTLDAGRTIDHWWPSVIIALGVIQLAERPPSLAGPLLLVAAGTLLLLFSTDVLEGDVWSYVWPAAIIAAGLAVLARFRGTGSLPRDAGRRDTVVATGVFGGPHVSSASQHFRGASLTAVFGGVTLDLRRALPDPGGATVTGTAVFGGIEVIVPRGWQVTTSGMPLFGGVEDKTDASAAPAEGAPALHVDAVAVFGGVEVKHKDD